MINTEPVVKDIYREVDKYIQEVSDLTHALIAFVALYTPCQQSEDDFLSCLINFLSNKKVLSKESNFCQLRITDDIIKICVPSLKLKNNINNIKEEIVLAYFYIKTVSDECEDRQLITMSVSDGSNILRFLAVRLESIKHDCEIIKERAQSMVEQFFSGLLFE